MNNADLHCFTNDHTIVIAETLEQARTKWDKWTTFSADGLDQDEIEEEHDIHQIPDDCKIPILVEDELKCLPENLELTGEAIWNATAGAWAQSQGVGFLCSEDY